MTLTIERSDTDRRAKTAPPRAVDAGQSVSASGLAGNATSWQRVCRVADLEAGWGEAVLLPEKRQVALFLVDDSELYAVDHVDPKTSAPVIARGIVGSKGARPTVASPLLKQVYDLGTGECLSESGPALATYRTRVVSGFVEIELAA